MMKKITSLSIEEFNKLISDKRELKKLMKHIHLPAYDSSDHR